MSNLPNCPLSQECPYWSVLRKTWLSDEFQQGIGEAWKKGGYVWARGKLKSGYALRRASWPANWRVLEDRDHNRFFLAKEDILLVLASKSWSSEWLPTKEDIMAEDWELYLGEADFC